MKITKENLQKCFSGGAIEPLYLYIELFGSAPNEFYYSFSSEKDINLDNVSNEDIYSKFPKATVIRRGYISESTTSAMDEDINYHDYNYGRNSNLLIVDSNLIYTIDPYGIRIYYSTQEWKELLESIIEVVNPSRIKLNAAQISLIGYGNGDFYTIDSKIEPFSIDIDTNYNDDFKPIYEKTVKFLEQRKSGLVLFNGTFGTGKTSFIKHLITNYPAKYLFITGNMADQIGSPEFLSFLMDNKNSIFILEDCEQIIKKRDFNQFNGAISHILNMSDGILSDVFNYKFICTFNDNIENVDQALLRNGRCYAQYEFKPLCKEKSIKLLKSLGHKNTNISGPMTLADIYNYTPEENKSKTKKIGF